MPDELTRMIERVLRDLDGAPAPTVGHRQWTDDPSAMLVDPVDGTGFGVSMAPADPEAAQLAAVADQVQEWVVEALWRRGRSTSWPECPAHPNSHPLTPLVVAERAVWTCPATASVVAEIGDLYPQDNEERM